MLTDERSEDAAPGADDTPPPDSPEWADSSTAEPTDDSADEPAPGGRRRPRVALIVSSVLLLIALGAGLAFLIPSAPAARPADQIAPSSGPATGVPNAPTALPLPQATGEYSSTEVIVEVGGGAITRGDFVRFYQPGADPAQVLNQLIQIELLMQEASSEGVAADDAAITKQIEELKQSRASGDAAQFAAFLEQAKVGSEDNLRRLLERDLVVQQMILRHTSAEQAHARHILLSTEATTDTAKLEQVKTEAEALMKDLEGGADFATLAAQHSDDPGSKEAGGDLGWAPRGLFVGPFDEAVFSMKAGERRLVKTDFGWHIIELLDEPVMRGLESADMLQTPAGQQAFSETFLPWIEGLQQKAETDQKIKIVIPAEQLVTEPASS
ncbi:MAG: peptidylprolyl isomerase [Chloroflexales bacterium]|nr:peptidylprolyl isomerase [Chloroflexales bacterium]